MSDCLHPASKLPAATPDDAWFGCRAEMPLNPEDWCANCRFTRRDRALTAARIRLRSPSPRPLLDETRIDEVCAELLAIHAAFESLHYDADAYLDWLERGGKAATSPETASPATIDTQGGSGHG